MTATRAVGGTRSWWKSREPRKAQPDVEFAHCFRSESGAGEGNLLHMWAALNAAETRGFWFVRDRMCYRLVLQASPPRLAATADVVRRRKDLGATGIAYAGS